MCDFEGAGLQAAVSACRSGVGRQGNLGTKSYILPKQGTRVVMEHARMHAAASRRRGPPPALAAVHGMAHAAARQLAPQVRANRRPRRRCLGAAPSTCWRRDARCTGSSVACCTCGRNCCCSCCSCGRGCCCCCGCGCCRPRPCPCSGVGGAGNRRHCWGACGASAGPPADDAGEGPKPGAQSCHRSSSCSVNCSRR